MPGEDKPTWKWAPSERNARVEGKLCETEFRVRLQPGGGEALVKLGCLSDESSLPPQVEVLLQVAVDALERELVRAGVQKPASVIRLVAGEKRDGA